MKIGFDAKRAFTNYSGLGNYSRSTIELLSKLHPQNEYILYTTKTGKFNFEDAPFINQENTKLVLPQKMLHRKFKSYWRTYALAKEINNDKPDVFHGLSNELPRKFSNSAVKKVVTIHDLIFIRYPDLYPFIDRKIYHSKFRHACNIADVIIAVSQQTKNDLVEFLGVDDKKIKVVYQGCNHLYYNLIDEPEQQRVREKYNLPNDYLLNVGTIEARKNALNIVKAINRNNIDIPLVIVGRPTDYVLTIKKYIKENDMSKRVIFLHNVPLEDLSALYQMSTIFIYPSIFEGFGIPILEALNSRVPVITSHGSCFPEAGGTSSVYVKPDSPDELAFAIENILNNSTFAKQIVEEGYKHALKFRENEIAANLMAVYE